MPRARKAEIISALFAAYLSNDRARIEDSFTGDFRFTSPYDDRIDKATYFERCWKTSDWIERHDLENDCCRRRSGLCDLSMYRQRRQELS
jgi:ketosteroid isomerase-like protein